MYIRAAIWSDKESDRLFNKLEELENMDREKKPQKPAMSLKESLAAAGYPIKKVEKYD